MKKIQNTYKKIILIILSLIMAFSVMFTEKAPLPAFAESGSLNIDSSYVYDDLKDMTIDGEPFSFQKFAFDSKKEAKIISFVEYAYSFYTNKQANFNLYIYVWNPQGLKIIDSVLNTISFAIGDDTTTHFNNYPIVFINKCAEPNYEGLFYKFRVGLTNEQKQELLNALNSTKRQYRVSEIELFTEGSTNAKAYGVNTTYEYTGYASGYGPEESAESTLKSSYQELETVSLKPTATAYRPEGTNGKNNYTQDSLHSVWFSVPNKLLNKYGNLSAVHAKWLDAVLAPMLVSGNQDAIDELKGFIGEYITLPSFTQYCKYMYLGAYDYKAGSSQLGTSDEHRYGFAYNVFGGYISGNGGDFKNEFFGHELNALFFLFNTYGQEADDYIVSTDELKQALKDSKNTFGGELVNDKYAKCIFESVADNWTEVNIEADESFSLTDEIISKGFWDKFFDREGSVVEYSKKFDGIKAITEINEDSITGSNEKIAQELYILEGDVGTLKSDYEKAVENEETIFLFRYKVSDYISQEATLFESH